MQNKYIEEVFKYDGTQLKPLFAYMNYGILGDSLVAWQGACHVSFEHMVDAEDLIAASKIAGDHMLHFIAEVFDRELVSGVLLQRMMASIVKDVLHAMSDVLQKDALARDGDDLYWHDKKLSISIASCSAVSTMVHFAVNISNSGTPVKTCSLQDLQVDPVEFAAEVLDAVSSEWNSIVMASRKVHPL